jgi:hypothetical protein
MYSAQGLYDGLYSVEDLPDSIIVDGVTLQKGNYIYGDLEPDISGAFYASNDEEFYEITIKLSQGTWYPGQGVSRDAADCLINTDWHDEFANSYTIQGFQYSEPFTVDRVSLCRWEKTVSGTLYFGNPDNPPATGKWNAVIEFSNYFEVVLVWTNNDQNDFNYPNQLWRYSKLGAPTEPNSIPSGSYSGGDFGSISVS